MTGVTLYRLRDAWYLIRENTLFSQNLDMELNAQMRFTSRIKASVLQIRRQKMEEKCNSPESSVEMTWLWRNKRRLSIQSSP